MKLFMILSLSLSLFGWLEYDNGMALAANLRCIFNEP